MKGHERDPRWSRRRRDTCILWSLGLGALITLLWRGRVGRLKVDVYTGRGTKLSPCSRN